MIDSRSSSRVLKNSCWNESLSFTAQTRPPPQENVQTDRMKTNLGVNVDLLEVYDVGFVAKGLSVYTCSRRFVCL